MSLRTLHVLKKLDQAEWGGTQSSALRTSVVLAKFVS